MAEVSIIVPFYNRKDTLEDCIVSIINQTFRDYELILIDDGSIDESSKIGKRWMKKDTRVRMFTKENGGPSSARNYGLKYSTGTYIVFIDSDDWIPPTYIEKMVSAKQKFGEDVLPVSMIQMCYEKKVYLDKKDSVEFFILDEKDIFKLYHDNLLNSPVNKLFTREVIYQFAVKFRENIQMGEDLLFNIDYLHTNRVKQFVCLNNNIYYYQRGNNDSLCVQYYEDFFSIQNKLCEELLALAKEKQVPVKDYNYFWEQYDGALRVALDMNMGPKSPYSFWEKIKINNKIIQSKQFAEYLERRKDNMALLSRKAYASGNYFFVWLGKKITHRI